jgi:C4-dicarboxylate-specific signal transduction histidine kinase
MLLPSFDERVRLEDAEDALAKVRSELARVSRTMNMGVLTAAITHEVNQPLSGVVMNANTCRRMLELSPPNLCGALQKARLTLRDAERAREMISRLRALFRKKCVVTEIVDLEEATREVVGLYGQELRRRGIRLDMEFTDDVPRVVGDRVQLQQVILNLLVNACDAMKNVEDRPKRIVIQVVCDGDGAARLSVRDSGVGVAPELRDKLFDAFCTTKADGMGIGLSVSRSIVEGHRGRLWYEAPDGPGAIFAFSIPRTLRDA